MYDTDSDARKREEQGRVHKLQQTWAAIARNSLIAITLATSGALFAQQEQEAAQEQVAPQEQEQEQGQEQEGKDQTDLLGLFEIEEGVTEEGETLYTFQLIQNITGYPWLAPLDRDNFPRCQKLIDTLSNALPIKDGHVKYWCTKSLQPKQGTTITMIKKDDRWNVKTLEWYNDWITLHADFEGGESFSRKQLGQLWKMRNALLKKGLDNNTYTMNQPPSAAFWQWLTHSYKTLGNGALTGWHGYEVVSHSLHAIHGIQNGEWAGLVLNTLSTLFHTLEGLEHAHYTGLGYYLHMDFHGDLVAASPQPHATNIGLASAALTVNILELLYNYRHGHGDGHSWIGRSLHTLMDTLHTGLHVYELEEALRGWWNGHPAHEHEHEHDDYEVTRLPASYRGQK